MSDDNKRKLLDDLFPKVPSDLLSRMNSLQSLALPKITEYAFPKITDDYILKMQSLVIKIPKYTFPVDEYARQMQSLMQPTEALASIVELNQRLAEATRPFSEIHRHMADVIGPLARQLDDFRLPPTLLPQIEDSVRRFIEQQQQIAQSVRATIEKWGPNFQALDQGISDFIRSVAAVERKSRMLSEA